MKTERVKISDLKAPPRNVRKHNDKQITEFKRSLTMFGQIRPVVIDEEGVIWCGNGLVEAARELGWENVDVYRLIGLSVKQKHKLMITDNRIYSLGFDDYDSINKIIEEIGDFDIPGFDTETLQNMFGNLENELESFGVLTDDEKKSARQAQESREIDGGVSTYAQEKESAGTAPESQDTRDELGPDGGPVPPKPTEGGGRVILFNEKTDQQYIGFLDMETLDLVRNKKGYILARRGEEDAPAKRYGICGTIQLMMDKLFNKPGTRDLDRVVIHTLRHSVATQMVQKGVPLEIISKTLDHASLQTTVKFYAKISPEMVRESVRNIWE